LFVFWILGQGPCPVSHATHAPGGQPIELQQGSWVSFPWCPLASPTNDQMATNNQMPSTQHTTVMLRNIPNNYDSDGLLALLDSQGFAGLYDFVYAPRDFRSRAALGYAFVNFISPAFALRAFQVFHEFATWKGRSKKSCTVQWSRTQGLAANIDTVRLRARGRSNPKDVPDVLKPAVFQNGLRIKFPAAA
jgi:hypothetical protein